MSLAIDTLYRNKFEKKTLHNTTVQTLFLQSCNVQKSHPPLLMAQSWAESTWEITNYGRFINQFPQYIIRSLQQFERINKKYVDKNVYYLQSNIYERK